MKGILEQLEENKNSKVLKAFAIAWLMVAGVGIFIPEMKPLIIGLLVVVGSVYGTILVKIVHNRFISPTM